MKKGKMAVLCIVIAVIALVAGFFAGYKIGYNKGVDTVVIECPIDTDADTEENTDTEETEKETEKETVETEKADLGITVMNVGTREVSMDEINYYMYAMRDYYVINYGEEPWGTTLEDGRTLAEAAKEQLYEDIVRTQILCIKAQELNISLSDEDKDVIIRDANDYVNRMGRDVALGFGITNDAVQKVYLDEELSAKVYGEVLDSITAEVKEEKEFKDKKAEEIEVEVMKRFEEKYEGWKADFTIEAGDVWDSIVIGSAG